MTADTSPDHGPIDEAYRDLMNKLARDLDEYFNGPALPGLPRKKTVGFFLTVFPFNEPGRFNYISNAEPLDVHAMVKEVGARLEGRLSAAGQA